jgi:hypothetical protein
VVSEANISFYPDRKIYSFCDDCLIDSKDSAAKDDAWRYFLTISPRMLN